MTHIKANKLTNIGMNLFKQDKKYEVEVMSPNKKMALIICENGDYVNVNITGSSVYGDFKVI